ncbi:MAG: hypothetical protein EI684_05225 [Candidatus Viridilinea halotolerans]|uniref:DUF3887 domain-containing protein n=1 Tax=Candidatus Viridilinea halotolerans TaxID=2491704 RepID=A0A426U5K0_9CHLR|nr:MAG: hypothetical protein EI684_05225 [Candidatus Viridilinea halotolerans]
MLRYTILFAIPLLLSACGSVLSVNELVGAGGGSPRQVVESFLEDLNAALTDPELATPEARRAWAERLASHFAPSERVDQRNAMAAMLARFAASAASPAVGAYATLELTFSGTEIIEQHDGRALVRVVDGQFVLRFYNANGDLIRERSGGLIDLIGAQRDGLPTLQVGENWFMTEG